MDNLHVAGDMPFGLAIHENGVEMRDRDTVKKSGMRQ
jgi:hypothetical protein